MLRKIPDFEYYNGFFRRIVHSVSPRSNAERECVSRLPVDCELTAVDSLLRNVSY